MEQTLIYVFDDFAAAERARDELLAYGFQKAAVELTVRDDEAGPVKGNFTVGDNPAAAGGTDYKATFANPTHRGGCMLAITPFDPAQAKYAIALMARYGVSEPPAVPGQAGQPQASRTAT